MGIGTPGADGGTGAHKASRIGSTPYLSCIPMLQLTIFQLIGHLSFFSR